MGQNSKIAWTDDTCNPLTVKGGGFYCVKVSPGCKFCYAEKVNEWLCRMKKVEAHAYKHMPTPPEMELNRAMLYGWSKKQRSRKIFVSSMTDVFGEFVPEEWIFDILDAMRAAPKQIFQVLTKRSERMKEVVVAYCEFNHISTLPQNIWLIVSVEDQQNLKRVIDLIATPCMVRGLSIEPLLGEINLCQVETIHRHMCNEDNYPYMLHVNSRIIEHLDWVIVGGESGGHDRVMNPLWVYSLRDQCAKYDIPFFFKQWGDWVGGKLDVNKGKVILEDDGIFWTNPDHPMTADFKVQWPGDEYWRVVSSKVGKKPRTLYSMGEPKERQSDNELLDGKHYFNFPKYLNQ